MDQYKTLSFLKLIRYHSWELYLTDVTVLFLDFPNVFVILIFYVILSVTLSALFQKSVVTIAMEPITSNQFCTPESFGVLAEVLSLPV